MNDPIINEIRKYRDEHAKAFNYDLKLICEDLRKKQAERNVIVVDLSAKSRSEKMQASESSSSYKV
jgi:hypothetical protein